MARLKAIILDQPEDFSYRVAYWLDVPQGLEPFYADMAKTSSWKHATVEDIGLLQQGVMVEDIEIINVPVEWGLHLAQAEIEHRWSKHQDRVIASAKIWMNTSTVWDGQSWVVDKG